MDSGIRISLKAEHFFLRFPNELIKSSFSLKVVI
jgi:hypothetical protein